MSSKVNCNNPEIGRWIVDRYTKRNMEIVDIIEGQVCTWYLCLDSDDGTTFLREYRDFEEVYYYD